MGKKSANTASNLPGCLAPTEDDISKLLACQVHIGTQRVECTMQPYVHARRMHDGIHIINLQKTWEKMVLAARIIAGIENPKDVVVISARPYGQRAALKFAKYTGAQAIAGRFTPGTFTNQIEKKFMEPRLLIVTDPRIDHQAVKESAYCNLPTIALCDTDSPLDYVDVAIPCNNKGRMAVGLMYWLLSREVMRLRGQLDRHQKWDVMPDLFFYRDPEEQEKASQEDFGMDRKRQERRPAGDRPPRQPRQPGQGRPPFQGQQQPARAVPMNLPAQQLPPMMALPQPIVPQQPAQPRSDEWGADIPMAEDWGGLASQQ